MMNENQLVSVIMITYCHEKYIGEAINGVFIQQTDFPVELIIANDNSPDQTDEVIKKLLNKAPENITVKYIKHEANKGMIPNFIWALEKAGGKYIALCEGDDYWTDPRKLQKQFDILEKNPDCVLCFAARDILENGQVTNTDFYNEEGTFKKSKIPHIYVPTLTAVFRNVVSELPSQMNNFLIDASLYLFLSQFGSFYHLREKVAVYRVHGGGIYSGSSALTNYKRSVAVRLASLKYLKNIDRESVAESLLYIIGLRKKMEIKEKKYLSVFTSWFLEKYFRLYLTSKAIHRKYLNKKVITNI